MKRPRHLSSLECLWVEEAIRQLCDFHSVSDRDEDYCSAAWVAFLTAFCQFQPISSPDFWPYAYEQIGSALLTEKRARHQRLYGLLSLDAPLAPGCRETFLERLPTRQGDFANRVCFWDFLSRLPQDLFRLAVRLVNRDSLEEARSALGLSDQELCHAVNQLQDALAHYSAA